MKKLLLADDSITIQKVVRLSFAGEDIEVSTADNGDAAIEAVERIRPDVVLADVFMPGRSGLAVCEYIKSNAHLAHIPVILLVGIFEPFDKGEASRVRYDGLLTKPFETVQLLQMVQNHLIAPVPKDPDGIMNPPESVAEPSPEQEVLELNLNFPEQEAIEPDSAALECKLVEDSPASILEAFQNEGSSTVDEMPAPEAPSILQSIDALEFNSAQIQESRIVVQPLAELPAEEPEANSMEWLAYNPDAGEVDENCILELDVDIYQSPVPPTGRLEPPIQESFKPDIEAIPEAPSTITSAESLPSADEQAPPVIAGTMESVSLSEPAIDDIVRRVILRLSDQVVRDIAWEVIPELAESVIREELQKHPNLSR